MNWVCLLISSILHRRDNDAVRNELQEIFGNDMIELRVMMDCEADNADEYYAFIRCQNYEEYISRLINSNAIKGVLPSYENPVYLSESEIEGFFSSVSDDDNVEFSFGDVVKVKVGYLSGLTGIVSRNKDDSRYDVVFRFHTRIFEEEIDGKDLSFQGTLSRNIKKTPVLSDNLLENGIPWVGMTGIQFCN